MLIKYGFFSDYVLKELNYKYLLPLTKNNDLLRI